MHRSIDRRHQRGNKCFLLGYCFHTYLLLPICSQICSHFDYYSDIGRLCGNPRLAVGHTPRASCYQPSAAGQSPHLTELIHVENFGQMVNSHCSDRIRI